ncbi:hypothetical protein SDC9_63895 [bioreactor metagenome]|uniref:Uncharacterized protein n=1 Tax=bioreactor metagenome TaxID=1076179 RepID=A0A644XMV5_9ZZZZ
MEVHLLVGVAAEVAARDVACDDHHGDGVQGGLRHTRGGVGEPGAEVGEEHTGNTASLSPGIAVGRMGGNLLMPDGHEMDGAFFERIEETDDCVAAQAENLFNAAGLKKLHELERHKVFFHFSSLHSFFGAV